MPRNNAVTTRGRPFQQGNPGRPKGARNRATLAIEALLDGEAEALTRKAIELAKNGDMAALRLCLDRLVPPRRDRPVSFEIPTMECADDAAAAGAAILEAVASGDLTPSEAAELGRFVESYARALEVSDLARRIERLEGQTG